MPAKASIQPRASVNGAHHEPLLSAGPPAEQLGPFLTVAAVASALGINRAKVLHWIARKELRATNTADSAKGQPRWRISREDLDRFLARRSTISPDPVRRRRHHENLPENYVKFYPE